MLTELNAFFTLIHQKTAKRTCIEVEERLVLVLLEPLSVSSTNRNAKQSNNYNVKLG